MIQIDMPMPYGCSECRFETEYGFCKAMPENFCGSTYDREKPEWCPLKEQEPVQVAQREIMHMFFWCCGSCGVAITEGDKFCRMCGKKVKWNG